MAIIIPVGVDTSGLRKLNGAGSKLRAFGKVAAIAAGAAGVGALVKTLQIGTQEFMDQQKVAAQTNAVLKSTGGIAKVSSSQIQKLSESLMMKSGVDDEAIQSGQNLLLTFTKIRNETGKGNDIFNQATTAMLDLSVAMGKDLNSSAILVGKALNDPVKGASALSRAGVQLTQQQKDQIKAFVESGRVLEAQKIILGELTTQFGGSAQAAGKTLSGQLNVLKQTFNNLAGELAATFLPTLATAATRLVKFLTEFAKTPTLEAKVKLLIGSIGNVAWQGIQSLYQWWTQQGRVELPARVVLLPSGRQQFDAFFRNLERDANTAGQRLGLRLSAAFVGVFTSEGRRNIGGALRSIGEYAISVTQFTWRITGFTAATSFIAGLAANLDPRRIADAIKYALSDAVGQLLTTGTIKDLGDRVIQGLIPRNRSGGSRRLANVLTSTVKDAIQSARQNLAGMAGTLGGLVGDIISGTSPEAKQLAAIRKQQKDQNAAREKARLQDAVASAQTDDEKKAAQQELDDWLLEQEATRLEDSIQQQQQAANQNIANLTESFNRGEISAQQFSDALNGIIGANRGEELGKAFAGAFSREINSIISTAQDIFAVAGLGVPISGGGVTTVRDVQKEETFKAAVAQWKSDRAARLKRATDFRKRAESDGGERITADERKEIDAIMKEWDRGHPQPNRQQYGLTALALGGILNRQVFTAGENGREAVIPLDSGRGSQMLRDALGGAGGSSQTIYLNVNAGLGTDPEELSRVIVESIKRYEKRNGSVFQGPIVSTAANFAGKTSATADTTTFNKIRTLRSG